MRQSLSLRRCEVVSRLFDDDGKSLFDVEHLDEILRNRGNAIKEFAYLLHDSDEYTKVDEKHRPERREGELKPAHIHLLLRFSTPQKLNCVASWFGIPENFIAKIKGNWMDACAYLIHLNAPDKYQYYADDVIANFDYVATLKNREKKEKLDEILQRIMNGEIREYNKTSEIDHLMLIKCSRQINEAFKVRSEFLQATQTERNMECIFITGPSGVGKTTLAKQIAKNRGCAYFISSGTNDIMCGYAQQEIVILDELRPSSLGLADLLKVLDNHTATSVKSRYKNKFLQTDIIIITSVLDIDTFYRNVFTENEEPITQLKRRCGTYIIMNRETIRISVWDDKRMKYSKGVTYINNVLEGVLPNEEKTVKDVRVHIKELLPALKTCTDITVETLAKEMGMTCAGKAYEQSTGEEDTDELLDRLLSEYSSSSASMDSYGEAIEVSAVSETGFTLTPLEKKI